ncbi:hypothetical protein L5515_008925 [Caenorhabditis briggsae]|uniref:Uncharacterized protein n=1 Tax=Caenorhabditis briggsae TaxID=6238 RepID=A0AAE9F8H8_CAEBR|nr:hypothetical protein L5515_008925 [Caenorhabditis briggsae]
MASKLKNRQRAHLAATAENPTEPSNQTDRRPSTVKEEGDEFPAAPNIAAKIAQRRLPRRTPTSHVKGVGGDLIRRRLSKTNDAEGASKAPNRVTYGSSFENSFDESEEKKVPEVKPPQKQAETTCQEQKPAVDSEKIH